MVKPYGSKGSRGELRTSGETYLVARDNLRLNTKIRNDLLDVKVLVDDRDKLERWHLQMKATMPASASDLAKVPELKRALDAASAPSPLDTATLKSILARAGSPFAVLDIQKSRNGFTFLGCMAEYAEVTWPGGGDSTVSIETVDATALINAARELGIYTRENVCYPRRVLRAVTTKS